MYLAVLYVQNVLRQPPGLAALYFPVLNLTVILGSLLGPPLLALLTPRWTAAGGFAPIAAGCLVPINLPDAGLPTGRLVTAFALMGVGLGLASIASTTVGTDAAPVSHRGVAFGLLNAAAQIGTALGLALVIPLASATAGPGSPALGGMRWGFGAAYLIAALGLVASWLLPAGRKARTDDLRPAAAEKTPPP